MIFQWRQGNKAGRKALMAYLGPHIDCLVMWNIDEAATSKAIAAIEAVRKELAL